MSEATAPGASIRVGVCAEKAPGCHAPGPPVAVTELRDVLRVFTLPADRSVSQLLPKRASPSEEASASHKACIEWVGPAFAGVARYLLHLDQKCTQKDLPTKGSAPFWAPASSFSQAPSLGTALPRHLPMTLRLTSHLSLFLTPPLL